MATPNPAKFTSDGESVNVKLGGTVVSGDIVYAEGWLGIAGGPGASDGYVALIVDHREYVFHVGAALSVNKGDIVYITTASLEGVKPALSGYSTSSGGGKIPLFKAVTAKDANNLVRGVLIAGEA